VHLARRYTVVTGTIRNHRRRWGLPGFKLRKITELMSRHLEDEFNLLRFAQEASMSEFHFSRMFKSATGQSPSQYFIGLKMESARAETVMVSSGQEIYPMRIGAYNRYCQADPTSCPTPGLGISEHPLAMDVWINATNLQVQLHLRNLYAHLLENHYVVPVVGYDSSLMEIFSRDILSRIQIGKLKDPTVLLMCSSIRLLSREGRMPLALSSLGAGPTEQKVFKRSNKQVESLSRRMRVLLSFLECRAAPSKQDA
jgi:AraC-like DNA-binding protein